MMISRDKWQLLIIDVTGAVIVTSCALGFLYHVFFWSDRTSDEIRQLKRAVNDARRMLGVVSAQRKDQSEILKQHQAQLEGSGRLPAESPTEEYFRMLSTLASQHRLQVLRQNPLSPRSYPGLLERRHAYQVSGSMPDLTRFLRAIEETDFWADVSYVKIGRGPGGGASGAERVAELTMSLFSAQPLDERHSDG